MILLLVIRDMVNDTLRDRRLEVIVSMRSLIVLLLLRPALLRVHHLSQRARRKIVEARLSKKDVLGRFTDPFGHFQCV